MIKVLVITLLTAGVAMAEGKDRLLNCKDVPEKQAIVCERMVVVVCPYDEHKKCYDLKGK